MKMSQAFHEPSINFHCVHLNFAIISTQTFEVDVSRLFLLDIFLILSFLPKLTVKCAKVAGLRLVSSWLFWPATGPY